MLLNVNQALFALGVLICGGAISLSHGGPSEGFWTKYAGDLYEDQDDKSGIRLFLILEESDQEFFDAIGCEFAERVGGLTRGVEIKIRATGLYRDPAFGGSNRYNRIVFAERCTFDN